MIGESQAAFRVRVRVRVRVREMGREGTVKPNGKPRRRRPCA